MRRGTRSIVLAESLLFAALTFSASPALALVTSSVSAGVLTVTSDDENDQITVRCGNDGNVKVNGGRPDTGAVACSEITSISVLGNGGSDEIHLQSVDAATFPAVTSVTVDGGTGPDVIVGSQLADTITGGDGNDSFRIDVFSDVVDGGLGNDRAFVEVAGDLTISDDTTSFTSLETLHVEGSDGADSIHAGGYSAGLDIRSRGGDDVIEGGTGKNTLDGGIDDDVVVGGPQNDDVRGAGGDDSLSGEGGNDRIADGNGADHLVGGPGNDRFDGVIDRDNEFDGGPGVDEVQLRSDSSIRLSDESIRHRFGRAQLSSIERAELALGENAVNGTTMNAASFTGDTILSGDLAADVLIGGSGDDRIDGSFGDDTLKGGPGRDRLDGSDGIDSCDGGPGRDRLVHCETS